MNERISYLLSNTSAVFGLVLSGAGAVLGGLQIISPEQILWILLATAAAIAVNQLMEQNHSSKARKQVNKIPEIEDSLSDALNALRRIELYQLAENTALVKVFNIDPNTYAALWGGFDPNGYYAYNPAYNIEHNLETADPNKQVAKQFAERYKNSFYSHYLFFTGGANGSKDWESFCKIMKNARKMIPAQELKQWDENVRKNLHVQLRDDIEPTAQGQDEFYLGKKGFKKVCIEPIEGVFRGIQTGRGEPHYYLVTTDDQVWDHCYKRFREHYKLECELSEEEKAKALGLELKQ
jgi:hypothetical protein